MVRPSEPHPDAARPEPGPGATRRPAGRKFPDRDDLRWLGLAAVALFLGTILVAVRLLGSRPADSRPAGGSPATAPAASDRPMSGTR